MNQTVPSLLELIQLQVDENPDEKGRFLLLGSNHLLLNRHIKESLAGRIALFTLLPLSFGEILERNEWNLFDQLFKANSIEECMSVIEKSYFPVSEHGFGKERFRELNIFGGYPEFITRKKSRDKKDWLSSYHQTYLETDLRQLVDLRNSESFEIFEKMFAQRVGNLMNISELARDCGLSSDTIKRFIGYYRQLFISWQAKPYHTIPGKRMMKMSKYYFYDTGLLRSVLGDFSTDSGHFFENTVLAEINKNLSFHGSHRELYFSRTSTGVEADGFFRSFDGKVIFFVEIKQSEKSKVQDIKHLKRYVADHDNSIGLLINNSSTVRQLAERIWAIPAVWLFG